MELRISINEKAVFALLIVVAMVSAVGITLAAPPNPGHSWGEIGDLPDALAEIDSTERIRMVDVGCGKGWDSSCDAGNNGQPDYADTAGSVPWSGVTEMPAGFADGTDNEGLTSESDPNVDEWAKGGNCPCGGCWATETAGPCNAEYYRMCTPAGWKRTSHNKYTCPYCPYIYSWNGQEYVQDTTILYKIDSKDKEAIQYRELENLKTGDEVKVKIVEKEQETSYIDRIQIVVTDTANGAEEVTVLNPVSASRGLSLISESDDNYLIMEYGDEVLVGFEQAPELKDGYFRKKEVKAEGYYILQ